MDRIALGSGDVFISEFTGAIPTDETLEVEVNNLGAVKGGASLEYKPTYYRAMDDSGKRTKEVLTDEEVKLKTGIMTWNAGTLKRLCSTARVTETETKRTVRIGGLGNHDKKKYVVRFVHKDDVDGDCRVTIVGSNEAGLAIAFAKDKETVVNAEFKAFSHDAEGTLVIYEEEIIAEAAPEGGA